jgi:hypothetical protein
MRAVCSVQHILFSLTSMIMFSVRYNLRKLSLCAVLSLSLCFLQKLNGIMHYRPNWAIICFQTPSRSAVCTLEQTQINTFTSQAISLPIIRSECPVLKTVAYRHRTDCLSHMEVTRYSHPFMWRCGRPKVALCHPKSLTSDKQNTAWVRQKLL